MDNTPDSKSIILYPEFDTLKSEVEKLRTELSMLVLERDELIYVECRNIGMAYMLAVGSLEYKAYEIECAILRLKRKAELIQARKNRQEKIVYRSLRMFWILNLPSIKQS
jgi:Mg2+ and Co2+ transporter CorA